MRLRGSISELVATMLLISSVKHFSFANRIRKPQHLVSNHHHIRSVEEETIGGDEEAIGGGEEAGLISTTYGGNLIQNGNMFDVVTKSKTIVLREMDVHSPSNVSERYEVWMRPGSHENHEQSQDGWYLVGCGIMEANGLLTPSLLPDRLVPVNLTPFSTTGLYVTIMPLAGSSRLIYSIGSARGEIYVQNDELQVLVGIAIQYPFGQYFDARYAINHS